MPPWAAQLSGERSWQPPPGPPKQQASVATQVTVGQSVPKPCGIPLAWTQAAMPMSAQVPSVMQQAWTSFARSGDPSCEALGQWPAYTEERRATMILGEESRIEDGPLDDERRAWDSVPDEVVGKL